MEQLEHDLVHRLMQAIFPMKRLPERLHSPGELSHSETMLLFVLYHHRRERPEGLKVSQLSRRLRVASPSATQVITRLEAGGYLVRSLDPSDRRAVLVTLTEKGLSVVRSMMDESERRFGELVGHLGQEDTETLIRLLNRIYSYFGLNTDPPHPIHDKGE